MANATVSRLGEVNAAGGDKLALFLKVFAGEVLTAFAEVNVALNLSTIRNIQSGKSASFPATWKAAAEYHTPGTEILGAAIKHNERIINIDSVLISHAFLANIDEAMNHYDVRSEYSKQLAYALSNQMDKNLLQLMVLAARSSATITGGYGGTQLTAAGYDTTANTLAQGIYDAAQTLDEKDIPESEERFIVLRPKHYNLLIQSDKALHRDWNLSEDNGTYASGKIFRIAGVRIVKSNHLPNSNIAAVTGQNNTYSADFSNTIGVVATKQAVGTVKLMDLGMESEYDIRRQGHLFVAKYACGHGLLRPELKKA
jgi:hypothetical protein